MSQQAFKQNDWQAVIAAHPLESHDPTEWLRYSVALLQTIEPGPEQGRQQQQAAQGFGLLPIMLLHGLSCRR